MSDERTMTKQCLRCAAAIERCAFCDEPDCAAITCYRCVMLAFLDRLRPRSTTSSAACI
jgi:hypothetical protein